MRVMLVVGARPQFVKAAPLLRAIADAGHDGLLVHTGQHYDRMSDPFFAELPLPVPDLDLGVGSMPRLEQIGAMTRGVGEAIARLRPGWVAVVGDTNSTLAGAFAASDARVRLAHVEAGLRSGDPGMPEEVNRVLTDRTADLLLCPSDRAVANLANEGIAQGVELVGDVMRDALELVARPDPAQVLEPLGLRPGAYVYATIHRAANADDAARLAGILEGLGRLGDPVLLPLHPRTQAALSRFGLGVPGNVRALPPVGYAESLAFVEAARVVVTDSGGLQKEAYWLATPCVTLRDTTEWGETVEWGWNTLVDAEPERIAAAVAEAGPVVSGREHPPLYGDGHAAARIVAVMEAASA